MSSLKNLLSRWLMGGVIATLERRLEKQALLIETLAVKAVQAEQRLAALEARMKPAKETHPHSATTDRYYDSHLGK